MTDVGRNEFDALQRRVDSIDQLGTRGVAVVAVQVQDLARTVARLEKQLEEHENSHLVNRRWIWMFCIASLSALGGLYPLIYFMVTRK